MNAHLVSSVTVVGKLHAQERQKNRKEQSVNMTEPNAPNNKNSVPVEIQQMAKGKQQKGIRYSGRCGEGNEPGQRLWSFRRLRKKRREKGVGHTRQSTNRQ